jgi:hypothetical protein
MIALAVMLILLSAGLGLILVQLCRILSAPRSLAESVDSVAELSTEWYRPMMRLLDGSDVEFLRSQPGFTPKLAAQLRKEHCRIFRGYLRCLETDFQVVCWAIKALMLQSKTDRPDLAALLLRSQIAFASGVVQAQVRVALYGFGIGSVSAAGLLKQFDGMCLELRSFTPVASPSAA